MKLEQLLEREEFFHIFTFTLHKYFSSEGKCKGKLAWGKFSNDGGLNLLVNEKINIIFPVDSKPEELRLFAKEYAFHVNFFKRALQRLYVYLSTSRSFRKIFASHFLSIEGHPDFFSNSCILPGNHSIRIVNLDVDKSLVLSKVGYKTDKLENAIRLRNCYPDLPGPKIESWSFSEGWYLEERIFGCPINRLSGHRAKRDALKEAYLFLRQLNKTTSQLITTSDWFESKFFELDLAIDSLPACYNAPLKDEITDVKDYLCRLCHELSDSSAMTEVSMTHGDFQAANILVPLNQELHKVYIIDWEYAGLRCSHYDAFVYFLDARSPAGLAKRISSLLQNQNRLRVMLADLGLSTLNKIDIKILVLNFLVDELLFRLDDTSIPDLKEPSKGLASFLSEMRAIKFVN